MEAYIDATSKPFSYMLVDLKPLTSNPLRYRSNSLSNNEQIVYREYSYFILLYTFIQKQNI